MGTPKKPIYVLPHGIEVIGEYAPNARSNYWRVRIRPHPFFPDAKHNHSNGITIHRSRAILASQLGRPLTRNDHAHHGKEGREVDTPENLEHMTADEHNRHHKTGSKHRPDSKRKTSESLKRAIAEGRRARPKGNQFWLGRNLPDEVRMKISETRKARIASGQIAKSTPPSWRGHKHTEEAKEKIRQKKLAYYAARREAIA